MRKLLILLCLLAAVTSVAAQDSTDTTSTTTTANTSTVNIFYVACESQGVVNFEGTMEAGYDIYYQLFSAAGGGGTALTGMRRVSVDGSFAVSEQLAYNSGTVAAGATGSARVLIARESDSSSSIYDTTVNDLQDGCNSPQNAAISSTDAAAPVATTTATGTIRSPLGGFLTLDQPSDPIVVIGVPSQPGRLNQPGVVFAECDQYPEAGPGLLYDDDNILIFWSWFAKTEAQVQDHINRAVYNVKFMTAPLVPVQISPIQKIGNNFWVFYTVQIGNLSPGRYGTEFNLSWTAQITDGYDDFGPGTLNDRFNSTCTFDIQARPNGRGNVSYNGMYSLER